MKNKKHNYLFVYSFYRFIDIKRKKDIKNKLDVFFKKKILRGTILIANEGMNASISGTEKDLSDTLKLIKKLLKIRKLELKINKCSFLPFNRIKVRIKKEIVSLGKGNVNVNKFNGKLIHPSKWNNIIKEKNIKLIDTRNDYEIDIGKFEGSINPKTKSFREFPKKLKDLGIQKKDRLAIYCTGGIRCEKASSFLRLNGFKNIVQLEGGILNYLQYIKEKKTKSYWKGECFVFDDRVSVNDKLDKGKYYQCHGCRHPITKLEMTSRHYKKGVYCPHCYSVRSLIQKKNSLSRQKQIEHAESQGKPHPFQKIRETDLNL